MRRPISKAPHRCDQNFFGFGLIGFISVVGFIGFIVLDFFWVVGILIYWFY